MSIKQNGIIFTNSNCVGCNRCLVSCPIPGANRSECVNGMNRIVVDSEKCIHCGRCLEACTHDAREYLDDTDAFLLDLERGENISLLVDSSFALCYPESYGKVLNYLKSRGAAVIYDTGIGADISTWAYLRFLDEHPEGSYITSTCPVVVNYLEKHSIDGNKYLLPTHSPAVCTAIYVRKYRDEHNKLAFIGSCIAKKDEFESEDVKGLVGYNVTYRHLLEKLPREDVDKFPNTCEYETGICGRFYPVGGGIKTVLSNFVDDNKLIMSVDNAVEQYQNVPYFQEELYKPGRAPFIVDALNCLHGCVTGPTTRHSAANYVSIWEGHNVNMCDLRSRQGSFMDSAVPKKKRREQLYKMFEDLNPDDFSRTYVNRFRQEHTIPDGIMDEVFCYMHKDSEDKRRIDCRSCGYRSCAEMAKAIALGYNRRENCVHFEKEENHRLYMTDTMTEIPNLNSFSNRLDEIIIKQDSEGYAAVHLMLLEWELVNTRYGYDEADKAIAEYAHLLKTNLNEDEMLARQGGVDFLAVIRKENLDAFLMSANGITVHPSNGDGEVDFKVSICAGVYLMNDEEDSAAGVVSKIAIAANKARERSASNCVYYDEKMREDLVDAMMLTKALPEAIRNHELIVYYQPKVKLASMRLDGAEALVRWKHEDTLISPARFIPLFERNGYVVHVDFYVLEEVCTHIRRWMDEGIEPVRISTNFSKLHYKNPDVASEIRDIVDRYNVPHELIEIEFTETIAADEQQRLSQIINELKDYGFSTSIDDFGSGYSSLNMLQTLDFQVLKLDKAFLDSGISNDKTRQIITSVIAMARGLNMNVVAEGVEKREELDFLKDVSCDMIQGFFFDRPMPSEEFVSRLKSPVYRPEIS